MQKSSRVWCDLKNLVSMAAIFAAIFLSGCSTYNTTKNPATLYTPPQKMNLPPSGDINNIPCERFQPSQEGKRAFLGIEVDSYQPIVTGFFYCNSKSPAKDAGIEVGDKITRIRGCPISTGNDVISIIQDTAPRSLVLIEVLRGNATKQLSIKTIPHTPTYGRLPSRNFSASTCNVN